MKSTRLELRNAELGFDRDSLFTNVNLQIHTGDSVVLVGPSGKGKTTLLKTLAGLNPPKRGELFVDGERFFSVAAAKQRSLILQMGMLFQKNALFDSLTAGENIAFPLRELTDFSENEIEKKVRHYLQLVGLAHAYDLFPDEMSGGMQKRLGIARALALEPAIVLYDDPTAGLDPITSRAIIQLIIDLKNQSNSTLVTITNEMNRAYQLASRIFVILDGEIIETGDAQATKNYQDPRVQQFIRGEVQGPLT